MVNTLLLPSEKRIKALDAVAISLANALQSAYIEHIWSVFMQADSLPEPIAGMLGELLRRVDERRQELDLSERAVALKAGLSASQVRTMRRQHRERKQRGASLRTITKLARALEVTPEWLMSGAGQREVIRTEKDGETANGLRLAGTVAAGTWVEIGSDKGDGQRVSVPPDPRYPAHYQSAYEVRGTSTDRFARPGDFLIVVDRNATGLPLRSGDIIIVTQVKDDLREVTARRYRMPDSAPSGCALCFESDDPRYRQWIELPTVEGNERVMLGGIVVGVYRPLP
jgi:SOS-response transcriptional repressor LexA